METISNVLFWISNGLLVPDIVLLILLFIKSLLLVGGFFGQYIGIRRTGKLVHDEMEKLEASGVEEFRKKLPQKSGMAVIEYAAKIIAAADNRPLKDRLLSEFEIYADKDMAWSRYLAKLGPMLGLMGTLIPMGPALVGLSTGDIGSMAYNMQVAFATTVVGMVSAAIGYFTEQVKQRWYLRDLTSLQYLADILDPVQASATVAETSVPVRDRRPSRPAVAAAGRRGREAAVKEGGKAE